MADHLIGRPTGGFLGIDIFFVISGFLITGLLIREHRSTGRIDLAAFYKRRVKRTLPVAWVVLAVSCAVAPLVLTQYAVKQLLAGALAAAGF